ncbi:MAG: ASKHA domain-containing protein [Candidatus Omnitrophota bacterium]
MLRVTFLPDNKNVEAKEYDNLLDTIYNAGIYINSVCAGDGICGKCKVIIKKGNVKTPPTALLSREEIQQGYVLACTTMLVEDTEVFIPPQTRFSEEIPDSDRKIRFYSRTAEVQPQDELEEQHPFVHSPLSSKNFLKLPPPTLEDNVSDLERLYREIRRNWKVPIMQTGLANLKKLGELFRANNWEVTVLLGKRNETTEIVFIEGGDTSGNNFGIAVDIGTTTVVAELVDLNSEHVLARRSTFNKQASFGADVISRIIYASEKDGLDKLHQAVVDNINGLINSMVSAANIRLNEVTAVMCAGNMTMAHLLLGIEPTYLRREPYVPTANFVPVIRAAESGIKINPRGLLLCLPGVSSYVGGDITAGVLASDIAEKAGLYMLIDIGTNGEIVLGNLDWLVSCASSAGPAFEGSGILNGMRAVSGAIQRLDIDPVSFQSKYSVIGGGKPKGLCGSGLIDTLSSLLHAGIIDRAGKFKNINSPRLRNGNFGREFVVAFSQQTEMLQDLVISEADIENLIRAKAAIYAAAGVMLRHMGFDFSNLDRIYIAGGFGNYLDIKKAIFIGLLPDLPIEKFKFIGNSSITGARAALLSYEALEKINNIARKMTSLELSNDHKFMDEYTKALFLPHTDLERFSSIELEKKDKCLCHRRIRLWRKMTNESLNKKMTN